MVTRIVPGEHEEHLADAVASLLAARRPVALTGAGISVESGIPDFRSPGGLWTVFPPDEYAGLDVFLHNPEKAWRLYRAIDRTLAGAAPNPAHEALARLECAGHLAGIITQNVDGLHQRAGNRTVVEMHGDHQQLQCLDCGKLVAVDASVRKGEHVPRCRQCDSPLKPNVVLFGENVRGTRRIDALLDGCDLLLVVGTSAQVYPAASLPGLVKANDGLILEFNTETTALTRGENGGGFFGAFTGGSSAACGSDYLFQGRASATLSLLADAVC